MIQINTLKFNEYFTRPGNGKNITEDSDDEANQLKITINRLKL